MLRSYKYELRPTDLEKGRLNSAFGACRFVYNLGLETKISAYQKGVNVSHFDLMRQVNDLRKDVSWLKEAPGASLAHSIFNLNNAYQRFFKGSGFPKFKSKSGKQSFKIVENISVNFSDWTVNITKCGRIGFNRDRTFTGEVRQATVSKTLTGRYFISILVETGKNAPKAKKVKPSTTVGIDLGLKHFAVLSDGRKIEHPKLLRNSLKRLRTEQRSWARKVKGSKRRDKQKLQLAKTYERVTNQRKDFLHKLSTEITNQYDSIAIESLNVAGMVQNRCLSLSISDSGWGEFARQLKYKAEWKGKNILQIGRFEPSSKMCSCGKINNELKLHQREWTCIYCGVTHDRDLLAAKNIKTFWLKSKPSFVNVAQ
jgi:putative transposase